MHFNLIHMYCVPVLCCFIIISPGEGTVEHCAKYFDKNECLLHRVPEYDLVNKLYLGGGGAMLKKITSV